MFFLTVVYLSAFCRSAFAAYEVRSGHPSSTLKGENGWKKPEQFAEGGVSLGRLGKWGP